VHESTHTACVRENTQAARTDEPKTQRRKEGHGPLTHKHARSYARTHPPTNTHPRTLPGASATGRGSAKKATPAKKGKGGKAATAATTWVKGTGYGGPAGDETAANAGRKKAEKRQASTDGACARALGKLADSLRAGGE
jgi:hypothetical protein